MTTGINGMVEFTYHRFLYLRNFTSSSYKDLSVSQAGGEGPNITEPRVDRKKIVNHSSETDGAPGFDQMASKPCDPCVVSGIR